MTTTFSSTKAVAGIAVALAALICAGGWFLLIGPKRSKATELESELVAMQLQIAERQQALSETKARLRVRVSDLYRLTKAMPDEADIAGVILDLGRLARRNDVVLNSVTPAVEAAQPAGYDTIPVQLVVEGRFADLSRYLGQVRHLVAVRGGRLDSRGRLFGVDAVQIGEADNAPFPRVKATLSLSAYRYTGVVTGGEAPAAPDTSTTSPADSDLSPVAAGATR